MDYKWTTEDVIFAIILFVGGLIYMVREFTREDVDERRRVSLSTIVQLGAVAVFMFSFAAIKVTFGLSGKISWDQFLLLKVNVLGYCTGLLGASYLFLLATIVLIVRNVLMRSREKGSE